MNLTDPLYSDPELARQHLERLHWPQGPVCPHCGCMGRITKLEGKSTRPGVYKCNDCTKPFSVTVGTIMEDSKIPLNKWLMAYALINGSKKGISAHQLHRSLGITYKSAWFLAHRIRETMDSGNAPLGGAPERVIEADETYVGGKTRNRKSRRTAPKKAVVALVERGGEARSFHVAHVQGNVLRTILFQNADRLSTLMTDEAAVYGDIGRQYWNHKTVNHSLAEYARGSCHTNTAENFFSIFKRGVIGTYHHLSEAHLHRYCREFDFRYNTRTLTDAERTAEAVKGARGKRLMYRQPSSIAA
ncbi:MAG TPA: IS1595 family transposase [Allosphingosinicella sp.]